MLGRGSRWLGALILTVCAAAGVSVACSNTKDKGGLMLAVNTDMRAPKDVNVITLSVLVNNQVKVNYQGRVTPDGKVLLPATVALAEPSDPNASIRIRVVAFQERKARVLRDVRTTIPTGGRIALLRLPLNFVEDGSGQGELPVGFVVDDKPISDTGPGGSTTSSSGSTTSSSGTSGTNGGADGGGTTTSSSGGSSSGTASSGGTSSGDTTSGGPNAGSGGGDFGSGEFNPYEVVSSSCPVDQTSINGECKDDYVDSSALPDYSEDLVGSGDPAKGSCFDVAKAFGAAAPVAPGQSGTDTPDASTRAPSDGTSSSSGGTSSGGTSSSGGGAVDASAGGKDFHIQNVTLDPAACALNLNGADPNNLNIAIVTNDTGECIRPGECYIPIDQGDGGWTADNGRVQLPAFVCTLINKKGLRLATAEGQPAKKANNPICAATSIDGQSGNDAGIPDASIADNAPARLLPEDFATSLLVTKDNTLFFAGSTRIGSVPLDPTTGLVAPPGPTTLTLPADPPPPTGEQPWTFSRAVVDQLILTNESSAYAYVSPLGADASFSEIWVTQQPVNYGSQSGTGTQSGFVWAVSGTGGGVYQTQLNETTQVTLVTDTDIAFVLGTTDPTQFAYVTKSGQARTCSTSLGTCGAVASFGSRVDDVSIDQVDQTRGYVLTQTGIAHAQLITGDGSINPSAGPGLTVPTAAETRNALTFRHQVVVVPNHPCVYFTSSRGLEWAPLDLSRSTVLVPTTDKPILGLAVQRFGVSDASQGTTAIYFTQYGPGPSDGGVWKVNPPAECGPGPSGTVSSGNDGGAGGGSDASTSKCIINETQACADSTQCCNGNCVGGVTCCVPGATRTPGSDCLLGMEDATCCGGTCVDTGAGNGYGKCN